jgi:hypothetical protein
MLGKLAYIDDLRTIWKYEEKEFTPWLAENITLLGEAIGADLEVLSIEHDVGAFSLDILAQDTSNGGIVAIENQLEITDHNHLGQIITYASGVDARKIIWITKEIREEHQKAIDWLNQITSDDFEFYGVEIQLIKIDDSKPAPFFNVKAFPNDWSKEQKNILKSPGKITERREEYHNFFTALLEKVHKEIPGLTQSKKANYDPWKKFPTGVNGVIYSVAFKPDNKISCELFLDSSEKEVNKNRFDKLKEHKSDIEAILGELSWERLDDKKGCRIAVYEPITDVDNTVKWVIQKLKEFKSCFNNYLKQKDFQFESN